jgi:ABC-type molybdate transport system permease subunit
MTQPKPRTQTDRWIQFAQLCTLIIGFASLVYAAGRASRQVDTNSAEIAELRAISRDLVQVSVSVPLNVQAIDDLERRVLQLERSMP